MLRLPIARILPSAKAIGSPVRCAASQAAPEKIEVFIDDKKVMVPPGTTVLQVRIKSLNLFVFLTISLRKTLFYFLLL